MNQAHLHITLVHIPVVLMPIGCIVLLVGARIRSRPVSVVALSLLAFAALVAVPASLLGEGAEEIIEHLPGVSEDLIEKHEEAADIAFWVTALGGLLSVLALGALQFGASWFGSLSKLVIAVSLAASILLGYAAMQGGEIRHPEISRGFSGCSLWAQGVWC